jgi:hypothetical protein
MVYKMPCGATALAGAPKIVMSWRFGVLALLLTGCSGSEETIAPDASDGRLHPPASGVQMNEADACSRLFNALRDRAFELSCTTTMRPCPELLRVEYGTSCMKYDEATVTSCASYYRARTTCPELDPKACALVPYPGTEPGGCP